MMEPASEWDDFFLSDWGKIEDSVPSPHPFGWRVMCCATSGDVFALFRYNGRRVGEFCDTLWFDDGDRLAVGENLLAWSQKRDVYDKGAA